MTAEPDKRRSILHSIEKIAVFCLLLALPARSYAQTTIDNSATGVSVPSGWSSTNGVTTNAIQQGGYYLVESTTAPLYDYLYSNIYSTINGASSVTIYFDIATYGPLTTSYGPLTVEMSVNGGSTWTSTQSSGATPTSTGYVPTNVSFAGPITSSSVQFRFYDGTTGNPGIRIKNIVIQATFPTCTTPATPVAASATDVTSSSFTANWAVASNAIGYYVDVYQISAGANIAKWTFPSSGTTVTPDAANANNTAQTLTVNGGTGTIVSATGSTSTPTASASTDTWTSGSGTKYWQVSLNTTGYTNILISSNQRSSGTGPRDFKLQYKVGAGAWTDVPGGTITVANDFTTGVINSLSLPVACENQSSLLIRWIMTSNTNVNGTAVAGGGTSRIDDIIVTGTGVSYVSGWQNVYTTDNFLDVSGLNANSTYYYVVRAVNGGCTTANSNEISLTTLPACTPTATISSFTPTSGAAGTTVTITGTGFTSGTGVSLIRFGTAGTTSFTVVNSATITVTVPAAGTTGAIRVTVDGCDAVSASNFTMLTSTGGMDIKIKTQFVNPCGADANNEFVLGSTLTNGVNIGNLGLTSTNGTDVNYYWYGKNLPSNPYTNGVFSSGTAEVCDNTTPGLQCFRFLDPGTPADATIINGVISQLNTIAGCTVFLAVPASGDIPAQSNVIFFLGAGGCGFDNASAYVNFSNHCDPLTGNAYNQYYVVVGNGSYGCNAGGFFSNSSSRASTLFNYQGGGNTTSTNYQSQTSAYTKPPTLTQTQNTTGSQAAVFVPDGQGGSKWVSNKGCIPPPYILLSRFTFNLNATKTNNGVWLHLEFNAKDALNEFVIEKSVDNEVFTSVTVIKAYGYTPGTDIELEYTDREALGRITYYRVRAVSLKELTYYSPICKIIEGQSATTKIFPNPADHELFVSSYTNETVQFDIVASNGAMLMSGSLRNQTKRINIQKLNHGVYIIRFYSTNGILLKSEKFMKQ